MIAKPFKYILSSKERVIKIGTSRHLATSRHKNILRKISSIFLIRELAKNKDARSSYSSQGRLL